MESNLDRIDFELIAILQKQARTTNKELAAAVGLAPSSCLARLQRLRDTGVLRGFHAEVAPDAMGVGLQALVAVKMAQHSRSKVKAFWKYLTELPEVLAVYHVTGAHDFLVHVAARHPDHLRDLALDAFTNRPEVAHIETSLLFGVARNHALPPFALQDLEAREQPTPKRRTGR